MKKKTGRPNKGQTESVLFKMTDKEKQILDSYSDRLNLPKAEILRQAFTEYINKHSQNSFTMPLFK